MNQVLSIILLMKNGTRTERAVGRLGLVGRHR